MDKPKVEPPNLDDLLTVQECAAWLRLTVREVREKSRGRRPAIPAVRLSRKVVRFHPRMILAHYAAQQGISAETIAAAFNGVAVVPRMHGQ